jgi:leucyl/phenylalanyl-tRNA--protein transferase
MILPLWLDDSLTFPDPQTAHPHGLLALGGDLQSRRILAAYRMGIFPWFGPEDPIMWWSPDPRAVLFPHEFHLAHRLLRRLRKGDFVIRLDSAFTEVIRICANIPRDGENGTWIVPEMIAAYCDIHKEGYAHSVEFWLRPDAAQEQALCIPAGRVPLVRDGEGYILAGACYGLEIGSIFCAESMFSLVRDASKVALAALVYLALKSAMRAIECQFLTAHLASLGARELRRRDYLDLLARGITDTAYAGQGVFAENAEEHNGQAWHKQQALFENQGWPDELAHILKDGRPS